VRRENSLRILSWHNSSEEVKEELGCGAAWADPYTPFHISSENASGRYLKNYRNYNYPLNSSWIIYIFM
jgi:hypothetical protein